MRDLLPGFNELHIAKVSDNSYIVRSDKGVVVTATNFGQAVKQARSFFDEEILRGGRAQGEPIEVEAGTE